MTQYFDLIESILLNINKSGNPLKPGIDLDNNGMFLSFSIKIFQ